MTFLYHCLVNVKLQINHCPLDEQMICVKLRFRPLKIFVGIITAHLKTINLDAFRKGVYNSVKTLTELTISIKWKWSFSGYKKATQKAQTTMSALFGNDVIIRRDTNLKDEVTQRPPVFFFKSPQSITLIFVLRHILLNIRQGASQWVLK